MGWVAHERRCRSGEFLNTDALVRRSPPLPHLLCALPEAIAVILGGVGDGVDSFGALLFQRQLRQYRLHRCDSRLEGLQMAVASPAHLTEGMRGAKQVGDLRSGLAGARRSCRQ